MVIRTTDEIAGLHASEALRSDGVRRTGLIDGHGRRINHLRLSVTSRCDLKCAYCRPDLQSQEDRSPFQLNDTQRTQFVRFLHDRFGLAQVRITGGEPLVYPHLEGLVASIRRAVPELRIAMTSNARLLPRHAAALKRAGLDRVNISMDSLRPDRYREITGGELEQVFAGYRAGQKAGFPPPKINVVALKGFNDTEFADIAEWGLARRCEVRFLEAMPIGPVADFNRRAFMSTAEVQTRLADRFDLTPLEAEPGSTARLLRATSVTCSGVIGLISPVSEPFCGSCRRIRVTADARVFPCLLDSRSTDLSVCWEGDLFNTVHAEQLILEAVSAKAAAGTFQSTPMISIGG